ncbi:hypothetical protein BKA56DRAFT_610955 [Ilyonectria sp. MPI-CAGE-AT-0026]|nr:hypothetical protein BKA56DRAFT_610955 [Ilyonectria sp. MPI-CAGE-AT-0026]
MRFLALLAAALPLVYSVPADFPPAFNPPLKSVEERADLKSLEKRVDLNSVEKRVVSTERSCGVIGYDQQKPSPFCIKHFKCTVSDCLALCQSKPECESFAIGSRGCYFYSAVVAGNFHADLNSPFEFYDRACASGSGRIRLENLDGSLYGYMSNNFNPFGERTTATLANALKVDYEAVEFVSTQLNLDNANSAAYVDLTYLSGIVGFGATNSDLGPGSYNYVTLGASTDTPPGVKPQSGIDNSFTRATGIAKNVESAIWKLDLQNLVLTPQWVNTDITSNPLTVVFTQNTLAVTGDFTEFTNTFGTAVQLKLRLELTT